MKKTILLVLFFHFVAMSLSACGKKLEVYYPLNKGWSWEYKLFFATQFPIQEELLRIMVTNFDTKELNGKKVSQQKIISGGKSYFVFIAEDDSGVYQYAMQLPEDKEPKIEKLPVYLIRYPVKVGTTWEYEAKNSISVGKVSYMLKATIENIDDKITVPIGTFTGCVKVKSVGTISKNMDGFMDIATISVENYDWIAPGIGLVKSWIKENSADTRLGSREMSMELISFRK